MGTMAQIENNVQTGEVYQASGVQKSLLITEGR